MRYLCLVYSNGENGTPLSDREQQALDDEALAYDQQLKKSGHFITAAALQPIENSTVVRVHGGKVSITDGPFAETKEHIAGFILIEARDLNDAIQVAAKIPPARFGFVEIRPVLELMSSEDKRAVLDGGQKK